jgi:hypothetical protein
MAGGSLNNILNPANPYGSRVKYTEGQIVQLDIDLGRLVEVSSIKVVHNSNETLEFSTVLIQVSDDGSRWFTIYDSAWDGKYQESASGKTIGLSYSATTDQESGIILDTPSSAFFDPKFMIWDNDRKVVEYLSGLLSKRPSKIVYSDGDSTINGVLSVKGLGVGESVSITEDDGIVAIKLHSDQGNIVTASGTTLQYNSITGNQITTQSLEVTNSLTVHNLVVTGTTTGTGMEEIGTIQDRLDRVVNVILESDIKCHYRLYTDAAFTVPFTSLNDDGDTFDGVTLYCRLELGDGKYVPAEGTVLHGALIERWTNTGGYGDSYQSENGHSFTVTVGAGGVIQIPSMTTTHIGYEKTYTISLPADISGFLL